MKEKQKIDEIKFIRVFCTICIVFVHFNMHSQARIKWFYGWWAGSLNPLFFAISGFVLFYNYPEISNLKAYYYKRWKSIYPAFYLCFFYHFMQNVFLTSEFFYYGEPQTLLLSLLGIDGYLVYRIPNYYLIGEWFLGAIILIYFLYPLLLWFFRKAPLLYVIVITACQIFVLKTNIFIIGPERNLFTCIFMFSFGMLASRYINILKNNKTTVISLLICCLFNLFRTKFNPVLQMNLFGIFAFITLYGIGKYVMKAGIFRKPVVELDKISFPIFLFHHVNIVKFLKLWDPFGYRRSMIWALVILLYTIIVAKVLSVVTDAVLHSRIIKKLDAKILNQA